MTSSSEQQISKKAVAALEQANETLSDDALADIAQARMAALSAARSRQARGTRSAVTIPLWERLRREVLLHQFRFVAPAAVAVVVAVLVSYNSFDTVPVLPGDFLTTDMPSEELAMLEDLEFASWLAEQQQEGHL
ncbi:hypothetical protein [Planctobacterium marinum]|uniref:hypothetical protein n=1 Tax=Planctobacterium marinum TaxID=1631968 RepID=UPI001E3D2DD0|nr:hypothetical protein [Planctobacterium marinum]MCC2605460.1 hypothetical protein [Planctobacterium marinum]